MTDLNLSAIENLLTATSGLIGAVQGLLVGQFACICWLAILTYQATRRK